MSEHATPDERTEMPTDRRMKDYRKKGQMHVSTEVSTVLSLVSAFVMLFLITGWMISTMQQYLVTIFKSIGDGQALDQALVYSLTVDALNIFAPQVALVACAGGIMSALAVLLQTDWNVKEKKVEFRFGLLNPVTGIKRIISIQGVMNTLKALLKLGVILPIGYWALKDYAPDMIALIHMDINAVMSFTGEAIFILFWKILYVLIAFAIFDYFWSKYMWLRQNKMTKEEVKDERKSVEGDEKTKRKMQAKGLQRIMERIRSSVPQADVVITNPTHYAIALKYDRDTMKAPKVLAKGKGFLALRIREMAKEAGVPILERKPLARALYASAEVGAEIPYELFKAVAEVLAYVYRLKNKSIASTKSVPEGGGLQ